MKYEIGDVLKLNANHFKTGGEAYRCAKSGHLFIILGIKDDKYVTCVSSSNVDKVTKYFPYNIPLDDAKAAGYRDDETHVKIDKQTVPITDDAVIAKIGHVSDSDYVKLLKIYNIIPNHKIITMEDLKVIKENIDLFELLLRR